MRSRRIDSVKAKGALGQNNINFRQTFELNYLPANNFNVKVSGEHYYNKLATTTSSNYFFMDAFLQWKWAAANSEINLEFLNIFNVQNFISSTVLANTVIQNTYPVRPRMVMLKYSFNF
jgi:hypothetical protein